ncbi:MAG: hypothetical protein H8E59_05395 [Actinobacteria bacterium]|nr:hypothetical protein [Actinomycetota bacterium]
MPGPPLDEIASQLAGARGPLGYLTLTSYNQARDWANTVTIGFDGSWHENNRPLSPPTDELYAVYDRYFDPITGVSISTTWRNLNIGLSGWLSTDIPSPESHHLGHFPALLQAANGAPDSTLSTDVSGRPTLSVDVDTLFRRVHYDECYSDCPPLGEFPEQTTVTVDADTGALLAISVNHHPSLTPGLKPVETINEVPDMPSPVRERMLRIITDLDTEDFGFDPSFFHRSLGNSVVIEPGRRLSDSQCTLAVDPPQDYSHIVTRARPGMQSEYVEDHWSTSFSLDWPLSDIQDSLWQSGVRQLLLVAATPGEKPMTYEGIDVDRTVTSSGPLQAPLGELQVNDLGIVEVIREEGPSPGIRVETTIPGPDGDRFVALSGDLSIEDLREVLSTIHEVC